jgi:hypothetical protein
LQGSLLPTALYVITPAGTGLALQTVPQMPQILPLTLTGVQWIAMAMGK